MALIITSPTFDRYTPEDRNILYVRAQLRSNTGASNLSTEVPPHPTRPRILTVFRRVVPSESSTPDPTNDDWVIANQLVQAGQFTQSLARRTLQNVRLPFDFQASVLNQPRGTWNQFVAVVSYNPAAHPFPTDDAAVLLIQARSPISTVLADDSGAQGVTMSEVTDQSARWTVTPTRGFRGTLYARNCEGSTCSNPMTSTVEVTSDGPVGGVWEGLLGGRPYLTEVSQWADFRLASSASYTTATILVPGIRNSSVLMSETAPIWRRILGLPSLRIFTGRMPAGYGERRHFENQLRTPAATMLRQLTARCFAGVFERRDNSVTILRKSFWPERTPTHHFDDIRYNLIAVNNEVLRTEVKQDLAVKSVRVLVYTGADAGGNTSVRGQPTKSPVTDNVIFGRRVYDVSNGFFVLIPNVPGTFEPMAYILQEPAPRFITFIVSDRMKEGTLHSDLWSVDVMDCITITYEGERHTGTLLERRFDYSRGEKRHTFTMIAHKTEDLAEGRAWSPGYSEGFS